MYKVSTGINSAVLVHFKLFVDECWQLIKGRDIFYRKQECREDSSTDLVDNLTQDEVSVLWATPLDRSHQQIAEAVNRVWQLIQKMEAAGQHGVGEGMQLLRVQGLSLHEALKAAGLLLFGSFPGSPVLLLPSSCCFLKKTQIISTAKKTAVNHIFFSLCHMMKNQNAIAFNLYSEDEAPQESQSVVPC